MEVKAGYKKTLIGVIPIDWYVKSVHEFAVIKTGPFGTLLKASEYAENYGVPLISVGEIRQGYLRISGETPLIPPAVVHRLPQYVLRSGDIIFGRKGGVDRSALIRKDQEGWFLGSDGIVIRASEGHIYEYLATQFQSSRVQKWLLQNATGTTMPSMNQEILRNIDIPFPPTSTEQEAIAAALSDVDALIRGLDQLIAKKRDIKRAAMQQLLTGKQRLDGFVMAWNEVNVAKNSLLKARIGWQGLTTNEYLDSGDFYLITGTDFRNGRVDWQNCCYVDLYRYVQDKNIQIQQGDILLTKDGTIGKVGYVDSLPGPATLNSGVFVIRPTKGAYDSLFFYYVLTSRIFDIFLARLQAGSTISHLYQKDFVNFNFLAPPIKEQVAIATVLSDMDAELSALEQQRDKTRAIKQGMMQELLTGRIRLV